MFAMCQTNITSKHATLISIKIIATQKQNFNNVNHIQGGLEDWWPIHLEDVMTESNLPF